MTNEPCRPLSFTPWVAAAIARSDTPVIITGAGGWLGQATLEMLEQCLGDRLAERVLAFGSRASSLQLRSGHALPCRPLQDISALVPRPCIILHYAFLTRDRVADMPLAEFTRCNEAIGATVSEAAQRLGAIGVFVPSSGAVYRPDWSIDSDMERNPYGVMKARDEQRFLALSPFMRVVSSRVFNLGGPFINKLHNYALSSILLDILQGRPITLKADMPVWRSYMHVRDVVDLAMALLLSSGPLPAAAFDTAGEGEIEIGDLAIRIAALLGKPDWPVKRPAIIGEANRYVGDGTMIRALMEKQGISPHTLDAQILDTAGYCKNLV